MDINAISQTISAIGITAAAFIAAYSARQTLSMVRVMERSQELNSRPLVSVSLEDRPESINLIDLTLTNAGNGLARDITFKVLGDNINIGHTIHRSSRYLSDLRIINHGIKTLAPHSIRRYWLTSTTNDADAAHYSNIQLQLTYYNADKSKKYRDQFELDFSALPESRASNDPLYRLADEGAEISRQLKSINRKSSSHNNHRQ